MPAVLVAYATKYGSTQEVAGYVGAALRECGVDADVVPASDVSSLEGFSAVVLGAGLYMHKWHRDALRFLTRNRALLTRVPVAVFAVGPVNEVPKEFDDARQQLDDVLKSQSWLSPAAVTVFGGRFDPSRLKFPGAARMLAKVPATDIVSPEAVAAWARSLPGTFGLETTE